MQLLQKERAGLKKALEAERSRIMELRERLVKQTQVSSTQLPCVSHSCVG